MDEFFSLAGFTAVVLIVLYLVRGKGRGGRPSGLGPWIVFASVLAAFSYIVFKVFNVF